MNWLVSVGRRGDPTFAWCCCPSFSPSSLTTRHQLQGRLQQPPQPGNNKDHSNNANANSSNNNGKQGQGVLPVVEVVDPLTRQAQGPGMGRAAFQQMRRTGEVRGVALASSWMALPPACLPRPRPRPLALSTQHRTAHLNPLHTKQVREAVVQWVVGGALPDDLYTELLGYLRTEVRPCTQTYTCLLPRPLALACHPAFLG